jgi:GntR family transcriptional regulator
MLLEIEHHSGMPIYRQVIDQIRRQIMAGQLARGYQIVSVRELAARLSVNPMTVSKAYALLEMEGLLERRRGIGLFVANVDRRHEEQTKARLLNESLQKAVLTAIQFGISRSQVGEMLDDLYGKYDSTTRSNSNEQ